MISKLQIDTMPKMTVRIVVPSMVVASEGVHVGRKSYMKLCGRRPMHVKVNKQTIAVSGKALHEISRVTCKSRS
jgi:hypothetical protein